MRIRISLGIGGCDWACSSALAFKMTKKAPGDCQRSAGAANLWAQVFCRSLGLGHLPAGMIRLFAASAVPMLAAFPARGFFLNQISAATSVANTSGDRGRQPACWCRRKSRLSLVSPELSPSARNWSRRVDHSSPGACELVHSLRSSDTVNGSRRRKV
jgi:hypothetical protein